MEIISQQACEKCHSLERCIETAMYHPEQQIRCVHFGYVTKQVNELVDTMRTQFEEYMAYLIDNKES
jgi:hypothetical protein